MYLPPPSTLPPGSIVDSYRRDSGGSRQDKSTDQQLTELDAYCEKYGFIHRHKFVDEAKSGGSTAGRDDFNRMIEKYMVQEKRPNGLLLWNYARFARDIDDAQFNKINIRRWGIIIHSLNDQVPEGNYGRFIEFFIDMANEEKRKQTSADAQRGLRDLVQQYGCVPGTPPRGIKRTPVNLGARRDGADHIAHRWDPDPAWTSRIKQAFQMLISGASLLQIHKETHLYKALNGYQTFFRNPIYIGTLKFGDQVIKNYCEAILDMDTWNAAQAIIERRRQKPNVRNSASHPRRQAATYLLSGLVYCAKCKSPLWGMTSRQRNGSYYLRYACTRAKRNRDCEFKPIPAEVLEKHVINSVREFFSYPENILEMIELDREQSKQAASEHGQAAKDLQKQLTPLRRAITNTTDAIASLGKRDKKSKALLQKLEDLESQEAGIQSRLLQVKAQIPKPAPILSHDQIIERSQFLTRIFSGKSPTQIRAALVGTVNNIMVDRNQNEVRGKVTFNSSAEESKTPSDEDGAFITASILHASVGAPIYRRSLEFSFEIKDTRFKRKHSQ
jgi:DNA invertase Pin-like site-specific DNA recombinase